ncbi:MAG: hypothetical protein HY270_24635 [Deltaproteobacteria bacterium]|nr:hypothetical protein [Deltaproteobacteria bacterium]
MKLVGTLTLLALCCVASMASAASVISAGPVYSPAGGGSCVLSGDAESAGGATWTCSGLSFSSFTNLYFGIKNNATAQGLAMNTAEPSGGAIISWSADGTTTLTYTGQTSVFDAVAGSSKTAFTRLTLTFQSGTGSITDDATTQALSGANGAVHSLWHVTSASFTANALFEGSDTDGSGYVPAKTYFGTASVHGQSTRDGTDKDRSHVDLGFYYSYCGDGIIESPDQCDRGGANGTNAACCTSSCTFMPQTTLCRASAGDCDAADFCTGSSAPCPTDVKVPAGTECRAAAGVCDVAENCDGVNNACPANAFLASTTVCRGAADVCDAVERCTGSNPFCPSDSKKASTTVCRGAVDVCDQTENCTGSTDACPADGLKSTTTVCRGAAGVCDVAENCTGTTTSCPADTLQTSTQLCRGPATACDAPEYCTGGSVNCPVDGVEPSTTVCRGVAGPCDVAENCTGTSMACPADSYQPSTIPCRLIADVCDVEEDCSGNNAQCPPDQFAGPSVECRSSLGICDPAENCSGTISACPADAKSTGECRPIQGNCDVADFCDGVNDTCPADTVLPTITVCRPAIGDCDVADHCNGVDPTCPADAVALDTVVCRPSAGFCDLDDTCDGSTKLCPPDLKSTDLCRAVNGPCDVADFCDGVNNNCPSDAFLPTSSVCRGAADICDVAEKCTGTAATCPSDTFKPITVVCRPAIATSCDAPENCTGSAAACPPDLNLNEGDGCLGPNNNTCLNTCTGGACVPDVRPNCCGNGLPDTGEQCDDGNQSTGVDSCPSAAGQNCVYLDGSLVRGERKKPSKDKYGCQVEYYVVNPGNPVDKFSLPDRDQICRDNDPTCDSNATVGTCRFSVVMCVNNDDSSLACLAPAGSYVGGISSIDVKPLAKNIANLPGIGSVYLADLAKVTAATSHLLDPQDPMSGYSKGPQVAPNQKGWCSQPMDMDVFLAGSTKDRATRRLTVKTKSKDRSFPRTKSKTTTLRLLCVP